MSQIPRGIRNNNPLNIKKGSPWRGLDLYGTNRESTFCVFKKPRFGFRAAFVLLRKYYNTYKLRDISGIIRRWAPETENQTRAYINTVAIRVGKSPFDKLPPPSYSHMDVWVSIALAMCKVENGQVPDCYTKEAQLGYIEMLSGK